MMTASIPTVGRPLLPLWWCFSSLPRIPSKPQPKPAKHSSIVVTNGPNATWPFPTTHCDVLTHVTATTFWGEGKLMHCYQLKVSKISKLSLQSQVDPLLENAPLDNGPLILISLVPRNGVVELWTDN